MKRIFGLIIICSVLALSVLATTPASFGNSGDHPLPATDVHLVKKTPLPPVVGEVKGDHPLGGPPGKDKNGGSEEQAATGILGETVTGDKYAIVIGICDYPGMSNDLCKSDGDSLRMYKALTTLYGYEPEHISLFKDGGGETGFVVDPITGAKKIAGVPTYENILQAIKNIKEDSAMSSDDEVVFFFSGHGADGIVADGDNESRDEGIVVYKNNDSDLDSDYTYIWDGELKTAFSGFATGRIAFVFDTCLAGGMNDLADTGRVISMGTNETQPAYVYSSEKVNQDKMEDVDGDTQKDGEGVFTHYFVNEGMLQGKADKYNHSTADPSDVPEIQDPNDVVIEEAFDYAKEIIPSIWKRQKPTISDYFTADLLL